MRRFFYAFELASILKSRCLNYRGFAVQYRSGNLGLVQLYSSDGRNIKVSVDEGSGQKPHV